MTRPDGGRARYKVPVRSRLFALCVVLTSALAPTPSWGQVGASGFIPVLVLGVAGSVAVEVLPIVAQFQRDDRDQVDLGWAKVQVGIGLTHLGVGTALVVGASQGSSDAWVVIGAAALGVGALWTGLGVWNHVVHEEDVPLSSLAPTTWRTADGDQVFGAVGRF